MVAIFCAFLCVFSHTTCYLCSSAYVPLHFETLLIMDIWFKASSALACQHFAGRTDAGMLPVVCSCCSCLASLRGSLAWQSRSAAASTQAQTYPASSEGDSSSVCARRTGESRLGCQSLKRAQQPVGAPRGELG